MKKIAVFLDNASNHAIYSRISGLFRTIYEMEQDIAIYLYRSRGTWKFDEEYNHGEYNIFSLPDLDEFDGFVVIFNDLSAERSEFSGWRACTEVIRRIRETGKPAISIGSKIEGMAHVGIDNYTSMLGIFKHMVEMHRCRSFWFMMGPERHRESQLRAQAIKKYLAGWDNRDYSEYFFFDSFNPSCGENGFRYFYDKYGTIPDAIICANDHIAIGACTEAARHGFQCPRDYLLTGFDHIDIASFHTPTLTTIDQNWSELGKVCIDFLNARWAGEEFPESTVVYTKLIRGQSCGCVSDTSDEAAELINTFIRQNMETESFNRRLIRLENDLMSCESVRAIGEVFAPMLAYLHCDALYLVLDRRFYSEREQAGLLKDGINGIQSLDSQFLRDGYPPEMMLAFGCEGDRVTMADVPADRLYEMEASIPAPKDSLFLPVHFGDRAAGYMVLCHAEYLIRSPYFVRGIQMLLSAIENFYIRNRLRGANRLLSRASITDTMTGFYNRMGFREVGESFFRTRQNNGRGMAILFADMNGMKQYNDRYGHTCGDQAILAVTQAIRRVSPPESVVARMGGDEFLIMLDETDEERLQQMIVDIRSEIPKTEAAGKLPYPPTMSIGLVIVDGQGDRSLDEYVKLSDERMYEEKRMFKERSRADKA
ncbi:MAG: GGDEF domain-containing protein [Lachnospiraceae bacterium]|nr:GGDEF domain-containing protein [Lachnospiraceae bacterium]